MKTQIEITPTIEAISKKVIRIMTKRHYSKIGVVSLFKTLQDDNYTQEEICKALALLATEKLIRLNDDSNIHLKTFQLLDDKGEPIKDVMVDSFENSDTFGCLFYSPEGIFSERKHCFKHLEDSVQKKTPNPNPECKECLEEYAQMVCITHNQSLPFCKRCHEHSKRTRKVAEKFGYETTINVILEQHNKDYWGI